MCPKQGLESCQKLTQAQRERQSYILLSRSGMGTPSCVNKRKESLLLFQELLCIWSASETSTLLSWRTMRTSRSPTTVMTANGEVQTREEATVKVKQLDLFVTVMLLQETPAVLSLGKLCEDHGKTYHWTSCQKPHCAIRSPWFIYEFLYNAQTYFIIIINTRFRT